MTLTPAYGRDYASKKDVLTAWEDNQDFIVADITSPWCGKPANRDNLADQEHISIRYKRLTMVCVIR